MIRCFGLCSLLVFSTSALSQASGLRAPGPVICSLLMRDPTTGRMALVNCRAGTPAPRETQLPLKYSRELARDPGAMAAGAPGRFWVLGSWSTKLLVVDTRAPRCHLMALHQLETEAGGYMPFGALALSPNRLFVGHTYGAFVLGKHGAVVVQMLKPARALYQAVNGRYRRLPAAERDDLEDMTRGSGLVPAGSSHGFIGAFSEDYFSIMNTALRQQAAFEFPGTRVLAAAALRDGSWLILGEEGTRHELWRAVADVHGGGMPPGRLRISPLPSSASAPLSVAASPERIWVSAPSAGRLNGRVLVFRRFDGRFLGQRSVPGLERLLGVRAGRLYLARRLRGRSRLTELDVSSFHVRRSWDLPYGEWQVVAFAFPH